MGIGQLQTGVDMTTCIVFEEQVEVPSGLRSLEDFRKWAVSDDFPERGRIDYLAGRIEVDMSPEDLFCHGKLKGELARLLLNRVFQDDRGHLFIDRAHFVPLGRAVGRTGHRVHFSCRC